MPSVRQFNVVSGDGEASGFDTFDAAERRAFARFRAGETEVAILDGSGGLLGIIRSDALERVWCDLTMAGAAVARGKR